MVYNVTNINSKEKCKNMKKRILSIMLILVMLLSVSPLGAFNLTASAETSGIFTYRLVEALNIVYVSGLSKSVSGSITIPSTIDGYPVEGIDSEAFKNCTTLKNVKLSSGITRIEYNAFDGCANLESMIIPKSLSVVNYKAFANCPNAKYVFYTGSEADGKKMDIRMDSPLDKIDNFLSNAVWHYNSTDHTYDKETNICKVCKKVKTTTNKEQTKTSISKAKVTGIKDKAYTSKALKQSIKVKLGSKTLSSKTDYTITYKNNKNIGTATVTIKGKGKYSGSIKKTFTIKPKTASVKTFKSPKKKQAKVTWAKDSKVTGYQIVYATNSKFTKGKKTVTVKSYKTTSKTITKLTSKKTYYVKVRSYKTVNGKKIYGAYSKVKKVKIK